MSFTQRYLDILVALRATSMPVYLDVMRGAVDADERRKATEEVGARAREMAARGDADVPDLTDLLGSSRYRDFLETLSACAPEQVPQVQQLLETREYELRLAFLKRTSPQDYLDELRVVPHEEIAQALFDGTVVNALDEKGRPLAIRSDEDVSGAFLETPVATAYVDAAVLSRVLAEFSTGATDRVAGPQGLRVRGAVVGGEMNLNWLRLPFPVGFEGCEFHQWVSANHLQVPWLSFDACDFTPVGQRHYTDRGAFNAASIRVESSLRFWDCRGLGQLFIPDAVIGEFSPFTPAPVERRPPADVRTVIDGARFGKFWIPADEGSVPIHIDRSVSIETVGVLIGDVPDKEVDHTVARTLHDWLAPDDNPLPEDVWHELEQALRRSGMGGAATEFGILGARSRTRTKTWGRLERLLLDHTVRYFYRNLRALWWLLGLLLVTFLTAFTFADRFVQSPLANPSSLPDGWFASMLDRALWSLLYAADTVLSPISLGQAETVWPESAWLTLWLALVKGSSLLLLGLLVVGLTGLAENRSSSKSA